MAARRHRMARLGIITRGAAQAAIIGASRHGNKIAC